jgi:hypothetical protein
VLFCEGARSILREEHESAALDEDDEEEEDGSETGIGIQRMNAVEDEVSLSSREASRGPSRGANLSTEEARGGWLQRNGVKERRAVKIRNKCG